MRCNGTVVLVTAATLLLGGCTTWEAGDGESAVKMRSQGYSFVQQTGWYRSPYKVRGFLALTKDGPDLQYISIGKREHKYAFRAIEKKSTADALPQDLAADYIADLKSQLGLDVIDVLENAPADLGGRPGFRLQLEYRTERGLRYREIVHGAATAKGLYLVEFRAPVLHYFDRDFPEFEQTLATFAFDR